MNAARTYSALLAGEDGTIVHRGAAALNVALVYPNTYFVGMSSLGFQAVYALAATRPGVRVERYFLDLPLPETLETRMPLSRADVIAFSISFELDFVHVLDILARAGLPLLARERGGDAPLIVAGGPAVLVNRLPVYDVFDVFAHGAGEKLAGPMLDAIVAAKTTAGVADMGGARAATLRALVELPGIEVSAGAQADAGIDLGVETADGARLPAREAAAPEAALRLKPPRACGLDDLDAHPLRSAILTDNTEFAGKCLVELSRGCPHRCTFCWAGHNTEPYVIRSADSVIAIVEQECARMRSFGRAPSLGFIAAAVGAHPQIDAICDYCDRQGARVSFSSLRVEDVTAAMLRTLARSGQRSLTLAPETASPRLRRLLGKRIDDEQVFGVVERAVGLGIRDVKLYFMIGLPTESDEEADEIAGFVERLRASFVGASRAQGRIGAIGVNLGVYVPHPDTPLARHHAGPPPDDATASRLKRLTLRLRRIPNVRVTPASLDLAIAQRELCHGDRRALELLQLVRAHGGKWRPALRDWRKMTCFPRE